MKVETKPRWILTDDWGIGIDALNWKLYKRSRNRKTNEPTTWSPVGYCPTLNMLAESLTNKVMLQDTDAADIVTHIVRAVSAVEQVIAALKVQMGTMDRIGLQTRPAGYRKYVA